MGFVNFLPARCNKRLHTVVAGRQDDCAEDVDYQVKRGIPSLGYGAATFEYHLCAREASVGGILSRQSSRHNDENNINKQNDCRYPCA